MANSPARRPHPARTLGNPKPVATQANPQWQTNTKAPGDETRAHTYHRHCPGSGHAPVRVPRSVAHGISGWVLNAGDGVHIEARAAEDALEVFVRSLRDHAPAASRIDHIAVEELDAHDDTVCRHRRHRAGRARAESTQRPTSLAACPRSASSPPAMRRPTRRWFPPISPHATTACASFSIPQTDVTTTPSSTAPTADRASPSFAICPTIASRPP